MVPQRYTLTDVELRIALYISRRWVSLDRTEAPKKTRSHPDQFLPHNAFSPSNLNLPIRTKILEVLVPEDQKLPLCSVQRNLVEPRIVQLRNLDPSDFCADVWADIVRLGVRPKEVWFGGVSTGTRVGVLCEVVLG
jgi:hypothetical protein